MALPGLAVRGIWPAAPPVTGRSKTTAFLRPYGVVQDLFFRIHAIERMLEQEISEVEVRDVLENGEVIEETTDQFGTRKLPQLHVVARRPLHVLTIDDDEACRTEVITAYESASQ